MSKRAIPESVKQEADGIVARFNAAVIKDPHRFYATRYRGRHLYLDRHDHGRPHAVCRLGYTGSQTAWEFAIFKYSDGRYDPEEWLFPGSDQVDGTIEGAMRAGLEAYP
jgi:hypothetical protein